MDVREEQIRYRAYLIWLADGKPEGRDKEHWKEAGATVDQISGIMPEQTGGGAERNSKRKGGPRWATFVSITAD